MARALNKLSARTVATIKEPGRHSDGGGLYLVVGKAAGARAWVFRYTWEGKLRDMGLGSAADVSLAAAREAAAAARRLVADGVDPIADRRKAPEAAPAVPTFGQVADDYLSDKGSEFRNAKHKAQWEMTLRTYAAPLRDMPVDAISTADVLACLKPIWVKVPETASRVRGRIERVLNAAKAAGHRSGENPAAWRGHLANLLPKRHRLTRGHHAAMPYVDVPGFVARLREREAMAGLALEFCILTAARTGEVFGATWGEIDLEGAVWTVPAARMKAGREHRVPLTARAVEILRIVEPLASEPGAYVFPGQKRGHQLSVMAFSMLLRRMEVSVTAHGFRSSFRDWAGNETSFPREIAEAALAHTVGDATERAYRRSDALERRRAMMDAWAAYIEPKAGGNVVELKPARRGQGE